MKKKLIALILVILVATCLVFSAPISGEQVSNGGYGYGYSVIR